MKPCNILYAQSGGVTAVINASAAGVIEAARAAAPRTGRMLAARNGILGVLAEELVDTAVMSSEDIEALSHTPGGAFGSCRFDLDRPEDNPAQFDRVFDVFAAHDIGAFLYNGGNGSMDAVAKLSRAARARGYPLVCIGVPKTVDNDLEGSDCSPGFGSAAKYVATAMLESGRDLDAMTANTGRAFVMEVMGRNAGWLAAATALAADGPDAPPHLILMPEVAFDAERLLVAVRATVERLGYCAITVSEGIRWPDGSPVMEQDHDRRGHVQLGGAGQYVSRLIHERLGYKSHWAIPDYLQRAAGHLVSATDREHALAVGRAAVRFALEGRDGVMVAIRRLSDTPYVWDVVPMDAEAIANLERVVPPAFIAEGGLGVTEAALTYLRPLIHGEARPPFRDGLPVYPRLSLPSLPQRLGAYSRT